MAPRKIFAGMVLFACLVAGLAATGVYTALMVDGANQCNQAAEFLQTITFSHATPIKADVIAERTPAAGVTVDGLLIKDGAITGAVMDGDFTVNGLMIRTGAGAYTNRTLTATADQISVSNGDGTGGNPTIGIASNAQFPGTEGINLAGGTTGEQPGTPVEGDLRKNTTTHGMEYYTGSAWVDVAAGADDDKVKISSNDTTSGYLSAKLTEGAAVDLTEVGDGGNETYRVDVDVNELTDMGGAGETGDFLLIYDATAAALKKINWSNLPGAGGGEANTASNTGTQGVGVYKQKTGVALELYKLYGTEGISIALNGTDYIDVKADISPLTEETAPGANDLFLMERSSDGAMRKVKTSNLPRTGCYRTVYLDAGAMVPCTTAGAATGTKEYTTNKIEWDYFAYDSGATEERVQIKWAPPDEWDRGTIKVKFYWSSATGSTTGDTVEWGIKAGALSDSDAIDAALGTAVTVSDALTADSGADLQITAATAALTVGGTPAAGDLVTFEIYRNTDGTDDMTEDAWLFGVLIQYQESATAGAGW